MKFQTVSNTDPDLDRYSLKGQRSELTGSLVGQRDADSVYFFKCSAWEETCK